MTSVPLSRTDVQDKVQEQERVRLEAEKAAQAEQRAKEDAVVRKGAKLMQVGGTNRTSVLLLRNDSRVPAGAEG